MENNNNTIGKEVSQTADGGVGVTAPPKPIKYWADPDCKRCYGTGKLGTVMVKGVKKIVMCKCAKQNLFDEMLRIEMEKREGVSI